MTRKTKSFFDEFVDDASRARLEMKPYQRCVYPDEYYAAVTISLGELIDLGFVDWSDDSWHWDAYNDEQYDRICNKIEGRYWDREIGIIPPGAWQRRFVSKMNEIMPKYKLMYEALEDEPDILSDGTGYGKSRSIYSDFPATRLGGDNQDYASNGTDRQYEDVHQGQFTEMWTDFARNYNDVDVLILDELEVLFSSLFTSSIGGF